MSTNSVFPLESSSLPRSPHQLFLVDDHPVVRMGLRRLFDQTGFLSVVGEAASGEEALPQILEQSPDLAIVDISLDGTDGMGGIQLTHHLTVQCPDVPVLVVSMHRDDHYVRKVLDAGGAGYVLKENVGTVLVEAIETIFSGQPYLSSEIRERVEV